MSIRPLDMQVMVPKLQEVASIKHLEQQKAGLNQQEISATFDKKNEKSQKTVEKSSEDEALRHHADAKEQGKNKYYSEGKKKEAQKDDENNPTKGTKRNKIDIKI